MIAALLDKLIGALTPPPLPDNIEYCPVCGGTMFGRYWEICPHCHGSGYVPKRQH